MHTDTNTQPNTIALSWAEMKKRSRNRFKFISHNNNLPILSQRPQHNRKAWPIDTRFDFQIVDFDFEIQWIVKLLIEFYSVQFISLLCAHISFAFAESFCSVSAIAFNCRSVIRHSLCFIKPLKIYSIVYIYICLWYITNALCVCVRCLGRHKCILHLCVCWFFWVRVAFIDRFIATIKCYELLLNNIDSTNFSTK